jgi:hypothetical protein
LVPVLDMCDHHSEQRVSWRTVTLTGQQQQQQQQVATAQQQQQQQQQRQEQAFQSTSLSAVTKVGHTGAQATRFNAAQSNSCECSLPLRLLSLVGDATVVMADMSTCNLPPSPSFLPKFS